MGQCKNCKYRVRTKKYSRECFCDNEESDFYRFYITVDNSCELWANVKAKKIKEKKKTANWREYHTAYAREQYQQRKAKGLCVICGVQLEGTKNVKCPDCLEKYRLWQRACRNRRANGSNES